MVVDGMATQGPEEYLENVRSILPAILGRAREAEELGRMLEATVRELDEVGVFRVLQPRQWGGLELHPRTWFESIVMIGSSLETYASPYVRSELGLLSGPRGQ